jgi:hypothetical protein
MCHDFRTIQIHWKRGISSMTQTSNNKDLELDFDGPFLILRAIFLWFESSLGNIDICLSTMME